MKLVLALFVALLAIAVSGGEENGCYSRRCPDDYRLLMRGYCIKILENRTNDSPDNLLTRAITECGNDGATPPIILSDADNDMFNAIVGSIDQKETRLLLGLTCNRRSRKLEWVDGKAVDYKKNNISFNFDCTQNLTVISEPERNDWYYVESNVSYYDYTLMCMTAPTILDDDLCMDYSKMDYFEAGTAPCYKLHSNATNWDCAYAICLSEGATLPSIWSEKENAFFQSTSASGKAEGGIHLGMRTLTDATASSPIIWGWMDNKTVIYPPNEVMDPAHPPYTNFFQGFPETGFDQCGGMNTDTKYAPWVTFDCRDDGYSLPFMCRRDVVASPTECPEKDTYAENELIVPPGLPHPNISCEYTLSVPQGQLVELTVHFLEANECCDYLVIFEDYIGNKFLANLTGAGHVEPIRTKTSNYMRVNWVPNGAVNVRGFSVSYKGVSPTTSQVILAGSEDE